MFSLNNATLNKKNRRLDSCYYRKHTYQLTFLGVVGKRKVHTIMILFMFACLLVSLIKSHQLYCMRLFVEN